MERKVHIFSRRRSAAARDRQSFLKDAEYVILDEATAFADPENERIIQESFKKLAENKTTLLIAHRLSTVVNADKILVIEKGRIAEEGKHEALLEKKRNIQVALGRIPEICQLEDLIKMINYFMKKYAMSRDRSKQFKKSLFFPVRF